MSKYVPTNYDMRIQLIFCYHLKKTAAQAHRMLVEAYGDNALGKTQCFDWYKRFKIGDFEVRNHERGRPPKKFKDAELQALLDKDNTQTRHQLAEKLHVTPQTISNRLMAMGMTLKIDVEEDTNAQN